jgi:hypothetical protein
MILSRERSHNITIEPTENQTYKSSKSNNYIMKLQLHSNFTSSSNNATPASSSSVAVVVNNGESAPTEADTIDGTAATSTQPNTKDWWSHRRHGACRHYLQQRKQQLEQAHTVADVIGKRNFENRIATSGSSTSIFPAGIGYGLMVGGATFVAVSIPAMWFARGPLSRVMSRNAARFSMKLVSAVAAGTVGTRYVSRYQTLEDLKVMGTYLSPTEVSPSADAISQHPIVLSAIQDRQQRIESADTALGGLPQPMLDSWKREHSNQWWRPSMDHQILTEYENVLAHCEERNLVLGAQKKLQDAAAPAQWKKRNW